MRHSLRPHRLARQLAWLSVLFVAVSASAGTPSPAPAPDAQLPALRWRLEEAAGRATASSAVARGPTGQLAAGGKRGVALRDGAAGWRHVATGSPVRDLSFGAAGSLWIAAESGLWQLAPGAQQPVERAPARGEAARPANRVAAASGRIAVAAGEGVFWSPRGRNWERIDAGPGAFPAAGLALRPLARGGVELWIAGAGGLFRAVLGSSPERVSARREPLPSHPRPLADVAVGQDRIWVLAPNRLLVGSAPPGGEDGDRPSGKAPAASPTQWVWRVLPLALPAGTLPRRIAVGDSGLWIATDRGLLRSLHPRGPWRRAASPAGTAPAAALALGPGGSAAVATPRGLLRGSAPAPTAGALTNPPRREACDPPIQRLQRAVLARLALGGRPLQRQRRGLRLRGLAPELRVQASYGSDWDLDHRHDQAFLSRAVRSLFDSNQGWSRERQISVALTWQLGDLFYHPEEIDISAETRRLIELRDDILDEVNQLYFDRRRALAATQAAPAPAGTEAALRAEEAAAGLDAWSAGWFSRFRAACRDGSPPAP